MSNSNPVLELDSDISKDHLPYGLIFKGALRPLQAQLSTSQADGSSKFCSGPTNVSCTVIGPYTPQHSFAEQVKEMKVIVKFRQSIKESHIYNIGESEVERFLADSLSNCIRLADYPRTFLEIVIHVLESDGCIISTAFNGCILALMDAGVKMNHVSIATTFMVQSSNNDLNIKLDPCENEEKDASNSKIVIIICCQNEQIVNMMTSGAFKLESYLAVHQCALKVSKKIFKFMRTTIEEKFIKETETLWSCVNNNY